ncbi:hypothetical protein ABGV42_00690 [Paenibacillus pabuli]|uniref:hypothetical protein n=1 Tax=Paenibacillus pabuli TaxID=1472 RepID=UPI003241F59D
MSETGYKQPYLIFIEETPVYVHEKAGLRRWFSDNHLEYNGENLLRYRYENIPASDSEIQLVSTGLFKLTLKDMTHSAVISSSRLGHEDLIFFSAFNGQYPFYSDSYHVSGSLNDEIFSAAVCLVNIVL